MADLPKLYNQQHLHTDEGAYEQYVHKQNGCVQNLANGMGRNISTFLSVFKSCHQINQQDKQNLHILVQQFNQLKFRIHQKLMYQNVQDNKQPQETIQTRQALQMIMQGMQQMPVGLQQSASQQSSATTRSLARMLLCLKRETVHHQQHLNAMKKTCRCLQPKFRFLSVQLSPQQHDPQHQQEYLQGMSDVPLPEPTLHEIFIQRALTSSDLDWKVAQLHPLYKKLNDELIPGLWMRFKSLEIFLVDQLQLPSPLLHIANCVRIGELVQDIRWYSCRLFIYYYLLGYYVVFDSHGLPPEEWPEQYIRIREMTPQIVQHVGPLAKFAVPQHMYESIMYHQLLLQ